MNFQRNEHMSFISQLILLVIYTFAFGLTVFGGMFDDKLPILGYAIIFGSFFVINFINRFVESQKSMRLEALAKKDGYRTKATVIARELRLTLRGVDENNESKEYKYYKVGFQYTAEDGSVHTCEAIDTYEHKDTAVLIWLNDNVDINVLDAHYCTIDTDLSQYYGEDISVEDGTRNIQETNRDISRLAGQPILGTGGIIDYIVLIVLLYYTLDVVDFGVFIGYVYLSPILVVLVFIGVLALVKFFHRKNTKWATKKYGVETYAIGFVCKHSTTAEYENKYRIVYSYRLRNGKMNVNEQDLDMIQYVAISKLHALPIKVYNDMAIIDMDKLI